VSFGLKAGEVLAGHAVVEGDGLSTDYSPSLTVTAYGVFLFRYLLPPSVDVRSRTSGGIRTDAPDLTDCGAWHGHRFAANNHAV